MGEMNVLIKTSGSTFWLYGDHAIKTIDKLIKGVENLLARIEVTSQEVGKP